MKVYIFYPSEEVINDMAYSIEEDGCPFTNDKVIADMFEEQRNQEGIFRRVVKKMTKTQYGQMLADYRLMEIILYPCVADVNNPEINDFPKAALINIPMIRLEKDTGDEGIGMIIDSWEADHYIPDVDEFRSEIRDALHKLAFHTFLYYNISSEFDEPEYELNTLEWFKENGSYFNKPPF